MFYFVGNLGKPLGFEPEQVIVSPVLALSQTDSSVKPYIDYLIHE